MDYLCQFMIIIITRFKLIDSSPLGTPSKKKCDKCHIGFDPPPPNVTKNTMYFFKKLDHFWGTFAKKNFFAPLKGQNTCKNF